MLVSMLSYDVNLRPDLTTIAEYSQLNGGLNLDTTKLSMIEMFNKSDTLKMLNEEEKIRFAECCIELN